MDVSLQPKFGVSSIQSGEQWQAYFAAVDAMPFLIEFENGCAAWQKEDKILFLSLNKEDKELPYEIILGAINSETYHTALKQYNQLFTGK